MQNRLWIQYYSGEKRRYRSRSERKSIWGKMENRTYSAVRCKSPGYGISEIETVKKYGENRQRFLGKKQGIYFMQKI